MTGRRAPARPRVSRGGAAAFLLFGLGLIASLLIEPGPAYGAQHPIPDTARVEEPEIPEPVGFVNDRAGVIDESSRAKLEAFLDQLKRKTGAEFAVLTMRSTAPLPPEEYKVKVFERWRLGKQSEDNGLLLLVALDEHKALFETGYGLEGTLPDGLESRIFREAMQPRFRRGDFSGGITAGVIECASRIAADKGVKLEWDGQELRYSGGTNGHLPGWATLIAIAMFVLIMLIARWTGGRRRRGWRTIGPMGWGGWGGGFGGGFGGGGGGFGGGGFGGFGGGSSGGGGGGGSW